MYSLQKTLGRIMEIEQRFGCKSKTIVNDGFAQYLNIAENSDSGGSPPDFNIKKILQTAAERYGVDPKLVMAVAKAESDFSTNAVSSAGAVGVMQLLPETAQALGVKNINDPRDNIDGGVRYLKQLLHTFQGDVTKAVAAYNSGPQAVKNYGGVPPYSETQEYVKRVLAIYRQNHSDDQRQV